MHSAPPHIDVDVKFLHPLWQGYELTYATDHSAGLDLRACFDEPEVSVAPGGRFAFKTGVAIEIRRPGVAGFVFSRSGLGTKQGLAVSQGVGVIDPDYRGEIIVSLLNTSGQERVVQRAQRIAQLLFLPYYTANLRVVDELGATARGSGGFGHSGTI